MLVTKQKVLRKFWYAVMPISMLEDGPKPFTLLGENIVVWLKSPGKPAALQDRCCHRTAKLSKGFVEDGNIVCGYHGWTFDCAGACVRVPQNTDGSVPAGAMVQSYYCEERYGYVWVALEKPLRDIPFFPEETTPGYRRIFQFYERWERSALRVMENSFDNSHFSSLHLPSVRSSQPRAPLHQRTRLRFRDVNPGADQQRADLLSRLRHHRRHHN